MYCRRSPTFFASTIPSAPSTCSRCWGHRTATRSEVCSTSCDPGRGSSTCRQRLSLLLASIRRTHFARSPPPPLHVFCLPQQCPADVRVSPVLVCPGGAAAPCGWLPGYPARGGSLGWAVLLRRVTPRTIRARIIPSQLTPLLHPPCVTRPFDRGSLRTRPSPPPCNSLCL
jgi:hypothetical protein